MQNILTRRSLLSSVAAGSATLALAGCATSTNPTTGAVTVGLSPAVADFIQSAVAAAAKYIPTIESIAATAASLFGPAFGTAVQIGTAALNQVIAVLTNVVTSLVPAASARLKGRLRGSSAITPVTIGTTPAGVVVQGYHI
jgi:hypothetical protein